MTVMLMTSLCWWLYDGDWFQIFRFSQCIKSVTNIMNRSPTSQTCHQHIWSPTSVTNIDVTVITITIQTLNNSHGWNFQAIISGKQELKTDKVLQSPHNIKNNEMNSQHFLQPTLSLLISEAIQIWENQQLNETILFIKNVYLASPISL